MTQYGGAIFSDRCKCGRKLKMPKELSVNEFMAGRALIAECPDCGKVESKQTGWK
jgi:hypothetical protein